MGPLISLQTVRFLTHRPAIPLAQFVDYFWFYDGLTPAHSLERVLPEGTFELLINLREEPRHTFHADNLACTETFRGSWIAGLHLKPVVIDTASNSSMMGVHFRPGGAAALLGLPASELSDRVIELDAIWGAGSRRLRDRLLEAIGPAAKFKCLEKFLLQRTDNRLPEKSCLAHVIHIFQSAPESLSIRKVAAEIGWSHKHLIATFQSSVGVSPKQFSRVRRFQSAVRTLQLSHSKALSDIALSCGYYDQPHFNSEFKAFSGLTPTDFLRDAQGRANFIPLRTA